VNPNGLAIVDLGSAKITIADGVNIPVDDAVTAINATKATVKFGAGSKFTFTESNGVYLAAKDATVLSAHIAGTGAATVNLRDDIAFSGATKIAVKKASAGELTTSTVSTGNFVYIIDELTIPTTGGAPAGTENNSIIVLGTVNVTGTSATLSGASLDLTNATLINAGAAEVTLAGTAAVGTVKPGAGKLTLAGGATSTTVGLLDLSAATSSVDFKGATTSLTITEAKGSGSALFSGAGYTAVTLEKGSLTIGTGGLSTIAGAGTISLGTGTAATFVTDTAAITLPVGTVLSGADKKISLGGNLDLTTAGLTIDEGGVLDLKGKNLTTGASGDLALTSGSVISSVAGSVITSAGGAIVLGSDAHNVTVTDGSLPALPIFGANGILSIASGAIVINTGGTIAAAGTGKLSLPNTEFGAGTYTATGEVTITALANGDTIGTSGTTADDGLTIGGTTDQTIVLKEQSTTAATFTLTKGGAGKVILGEDGSDMAVITIPAGGELRASAAGTIEIGSANTGGITLTGDGDTGDNDGRIYLVENATFGDGTDSITAAASISGSFDDFTVDNATTPDDVVVTPGTAGSDTTIDKDSDFDAT
jgi:hypothetical protein